MSNELQQDLATRVTGLDPDARRGVYERAREALQNDVRASAPFLPVQTVIARRRELENAIMAVEREAAKADPPKSRLASTPVVEAKATAAEAEPPESAGAVSVTPTTDAVSGPAQSPQTPLSESEDQPEAEPRARQDAQFEVAAGAAEAQFFSELLDAPLRPPAREEPEPQAQTNPVSMPQAALSPPAAAALETGAETGSFSGADQADVGVETPDGALAISRARPLALYFAVVALILCAAALAALLVGFSFEPSPSSGAGRTPPRAAPAALPKPEPPEAKLLRDAGFVDAARHTLEEGNAHLARREYARAIASYDDTIRLDPNNVAALRNRAYANWSLDRVDAAIRDFGAAIDRAPSDMELRYNRAVAYNRSGEFRLAVTDLDRVIAAGSPTPAALNSRCWAHAMLAHLEEALADCNEAVKLKPGDADILDSRGFVFLRLGRLDRAIADYSAALNIQPKSAGSLYGRGLAKIGRGDRAGGQEDVAAARALDPGIVEKFESFGVR